MKSLRMDMRGTVQGVGFRPWVYRLARQLELKGFVQNTSQGARVEVEGQEKGIEDFIKTIRTQPPVHCVITQLSFTDIKHQGFGQFQILSSLDDHRHEAFVLPDIATCPECLKEIFDPSNPRYLYPFTNCTHCGPRYSIIEALPYDRSNTSMKGFLMCPSCQAEYDDPLNRRFHAQPNACPVCGPQIFLWDDQGQKIACFKEALNQAADLIKEGRIVAVKGIGGFHLMADALNSQAILLLRKRKKRPHKPFAVMMPSLNMASQYCQISFLEAQNLQAPAAPIVLLNKNEEWLKVSEEVAPDNPYLGVLLPCLPLHHILMRILDRPIVATSGNFSEEPICIDNDEALGRLKGIADFFLLHDRPIVRQVDDSVIQIVCGSPSFLRRSRGYAPLPVDIGFDISGTLAVGAHQKNTIAIGLEQGVIVSQHIGDLDNEISCKAFESTIDSLESIYDTPIERVVCDQHPDYASSRFARSLNVKTIDVQHHHAHAASCMAEHGIKEEVLGVCWDGTGAGPDGTVWGGEFLTTNGADYERLAHLKLFSLPGAKQAIREPSRSALGLLFELCQGRWEEFKDLPCVKAFNPSQLALIRKMIEQKINTPHTSSMGRLFDGISSIIGLCHKASFEGQAAMSLEFRASNTLALPFYCYKITSAQQDASFFGGEPKQGEMILVDWSPMVTGIIEDFRQGIQAASIASRLHRTLAEIIIDIARLANKNKVVLTGGCFQNKFLTQMAVDRLRQEGFSPYWQQQVPANDGGISLGQMYIAARRLKNVSGNPGKN
ncbi:MAG: carbamoyltransferase HypF [Candidatus Omnitrophica bacterium]|nr:carbamoyltransferase HypF [Candidatus Omnitrophota bacterium]